MVISFDSNGNMVVTKTFSNPSFTFRPAAYTGGIPSGSDLNIPGGGTASQGIIVYYDQIAGAGSQSPSWTLKQYADGTGDPLSFNVKVFLVKSGSDSGEGSNHQKTKYK